MKHTLLITFLALTTTVFAQTNEFVIQTNKPGAPIQSTMYGIFFEDINFAADGGLYAELVMNRSFEYLDPLAGWEITGNVTVLSDGPFSRNPHYVRLVPTGKPQRTMLENCGFFGIGVKKDSLYRFSVWARCPEGGQAELNIDLVDNASMADNLKIGHSSLVVDGKEWKKYSVLIQSSETMSNAHLRVWNYSQTTTDVEHISLFPNATWRGRDNGLREDLAQSLYDLHPGVMRFPGGCIVEGTYLETRYHWKNTVGPVENRPINENRWNYTFHRYFPNYYQSYGLGFFEFFQLCEDLGCEALPVISCGMACQFQNPENSTTAYVPLDQMDPYIQDALDLIEFANGATTTTWGKVRAEMGHPEPFNMHYLAIGNEQWDYKDNPAYTSRLKKFLDVLKKAHPEIKYIGSTGPDSEGWKFDLLQPKMKELGVDLYDEHFYRNEKWFTDSINRHRYDNYDRSKKAPKVFAGEYACHVAGKKWNHFDAALLEAAFMTGYERNADVVHMATYAPLFAHVAGWQWRPDLIWFDNLNMFKTTSYYVQQLYGTYKGDQVVPLTMNKKIVAGDADQNGLFASATIDKQNNALIIKVANISDTPQPVSLKLAGKKQSISSGKVITLHAEHGTDENTIANPTAVQPTEAEIEGAGNPLLITIPARSFQVYILNK